VRGKKAKREKKNDKEKEKYANDLREELKTPSTRQYKWIILIYFIYFILPCRDRCSKAQSGVLNFKK
jgi:hypothetical protein